MRLSDFIESHYSNLTEQVETDLFLADLVLAIQF